MISGTWARDMSDSRLVVLGGRNLEDGDGGDEG